MYDWMMRAEGVEGFSTSTYCFPSTYLRRLSSPCSELRDLTAIEVDSPQHFLSQIFPGHWS